MGSRLALGGATVALVTLVSGGTAILVNHGTRQLQAPQSAPAPRVVEPVAPPTPLVVPRSPGSALFGPEAPRTPVAPVVRVEPGGAVEAPAPPVVEPPVVEPPVVEPPVVEPPVVEPPVVEPPVVEPPVVGPVPSPTPAVKPGKGYRKLVKGDNGHHYGQFVHPHQRD